ncbi:MAG: DUF4330 domain-containing protein [Bacillota bacterium]
MKNTKIFNKIYLVDFIVGFLIIAVLFASGFLFLKSTNKINIDNQKSTTVELTLFLSEVRSPTFSNLNIDDKINIFETKKELGIIIDKKVEKSEIVTTLPNGEVKKVKLVDKHDCYLTVKARAKVTEDDIIIGNKKIKIGQLMKITTQKVETTPVIYGIKIIK